MRINEEKICEYCDGTGETEYMNYTMGEPDGVNTQKCICSIVTEQDMSDEEYEDRCEL
jgi:hypothetical protein